MWRIENQQWRMAKSLFEDRESYNQNSPIQYIKNVSIPLLIWTGEKDNNVNTSQTIEFYLALKRLEKQAIMLFYPNEGHNIIKEKNQRDLSQRILNWFDYYLKDKVQNP
ncbi:x-prolyl-dipeptidyl aminopeptidase [compost metagenome]